MNRRIISTNDAPSAIGPYSQGMVVGEFLYTSGQIPLNPKTGELETDIEKATVQVMENINGILKAAGSSYDKVIKTTIFLNDIKNFGKVNEIYARYFNDNPPARSCIEVSNLPKNAVIEIEAIAYI